MTDPIVIGFNQNKWLKDSNTKMITGYLEDHSGTTTFHVNAVDYQVPTGKKLTILWFDVLKTSGAGSLRIIESSNVNSSTGTIKWAKYTSPDTSTVNKNKIVNCFITFTAGKYPNLYTSSGYCSGTFLGVEENV